MRISLLGAPIQTGTDRGGCVMGPDAYRTAQLPETLSALGHDVDDLGNLALGTAPEVSCSRAAYPSSPVSMSNLAHCVVVSEIGDEPLGRLDHRGLHRLLAVRAPTMS